MKKTLLLSSLLFGSVLCASEDVRANSGWYAGLNFGIVNFGGSFEVEDDYTNWESSSDIDSSPVMIKGGYLMSNENRIEGYYKQDSVSIQEGLFNGERFETSTVGVRYEVGLSSFAQEKLLPYVGVGLGFGTSSSKYLAHDDGQVAELDVGLGVHYSVLPQVNISGGVFRRTVFNLVESSYNDYATLATTNGLEVGVSYHF